MKKGFAIGLGIFIAVAVLAVAVWTIANYINVSRWDIHRSMSTSEQDKLSNLGLMPDIAGELEYYAVMGARDPSYLSGTRCYDSVDAMCEALPEGYGEVLSGVIEEGVYEKTNDVFGAPVSKYPINKDLPVITEDEVDKQYYSQALGAFRGYYILLYEDGSCRFEMRIDTV